MKKNDNILFEKIGSEVPFTVPDNYFDQFASKIELQIGHNHFPIKRNVKSWMYLAAMFIGVLITGQILYTAYQNKSVIRDENYDMYVLSQVDDGSLIDYYVDESTNN